MAAGPWLKDAEGWKSGIAFAKAKLLRFGVRIIVTPLIYPTCRQPLPTDPHDTPGLLN